MSRQVDVKALISHIVRGDGTNKCRICMGDTSEGQVYLGDTVMMEEDRPVTLSELLELITGVEVPLDEDLPWGLCPSCTESAVSAASFQNFCRQASEYWHHAVQILNSLPDVTAFEPNQTLHAIIETQGNKFNIADIKIDETEINEEYISDYFDTDYKADDVVNLKATNIKKNSKVYICPDCEKSFLNPKSLYDHLKDSTENKIPCFICALFMARDELINHMNNIHQTELYNCHKCPALLRTVKELQGHLTKAHSKGDHFCGECGQTFKSQHALYGHTTLHLSKNCPNCDKLFRNRKCYTVHVKKCCNLDSTRKDTYRTKTKTFYEVENIKENKTLKVGARGSVDKTCICDYCGKKYAGKKFVSAHIQIVHMKNTHRPCPHCGKFYAAAHMTEHIKKHGKMATFKCEHCEVVLKTKLGYIQHKRLHTGEKPYKCNYCSQTFSASSRRSEHVRNTHKTPDQIVLKHCCEFCPAKFRLPYRLKQHIDNVHTQNGNNGKEYECPDCHVKFRSIRGLLYHSKKHQTFHLKPTNKNKVNVEESSNEVKL